MSHREPWYYLVWVTLDNPTQKGRDALKQALVNAFTVSGQEISLDQVEESSAREKTEGLGDTRLGIVAPLDDASETVRNLLEKIINDTCLVSGKVTVSAAID